MNIFSKFVAGTGIVVASYGLIHHDSSLPNMDGLGSNHSSLRYGVEGIISKKGRAVFHIITGNQSIKCIKGSENFPKNTHKISEHPVNNYGYEATAQFEKLDPTKKTTISLSSNGDYFIVRQDGNEVFKSFVTEKGQFSVTEINDKQTLFSKIKTCSGSNI